MTLSGSIDQIARADLNPPATEAGGQRVADRIIVLRSANSAYDSLGCILEMIGDYFVEDGHEVTVFSFDQPGWPDRLGGLLAEGGWTFALTMSGIGTDTMTEAGRLLWEVAGVPLFNWNCDHPCYYPSRHGMSSRFLLHGYVFPDHAHYTQAHFNPTGMAFAAHLGMPDRTRFAAAPVGLRHRNGRIMFSKTGRDTAPIELHWRSLAPVVQTILFNAAEELYPASTADFLPVLQHIAAPLGILLDGNSAFTLDLILHLDAYIRFKRANAVMRRLLDHPIDVFGRGWDHLRGEGKAARFLGPAGFDYMMEHLPEYLGCLSLNPLTEDSVHDRVFFALAAGVVPVSDDNHFARAHLPRLARYRFDWQPSSLEAAVAALIEDRGRAIAHAEASYQALLPEFTLRHAARRIVQFAGLHAMNHRVRA